MKSKNEDKEEKWGNVRGGEKTKGKKKKRKRTNVWMEKNEEIRKNKLK